MVKAGVRHHELLIPMWNNVRRVEIVMLHASHFYAKQPLHLYLNGEYLTTLSSWKPHKLKLLFTAPSLFTFQITTKKPLLFTSVWLEPDKQYILAIADHPRYVGKLRMLFCSRNLKNVKGISRLSFWHLACQMPPLDLATLDGWLYFSDVDYQEHTQELILNPGYVVLNVYEAKTERKLTQVSLPLPLNRSQILFLLSDDQQYRWLLLPV